MLPDCHGVSSMLHTCCLTDLKCCITFAYHYGIRRLLMSIIFLDWKCLITYLHIYAGANRNRTYIVSISIFCCFNS